jgi:hypothetical protein
MRQSDGVNRPSVLINLGFSAETRRTEMNPAVGQITQRRFPITYSSVGASAETKPMGAFALGMMAVVGTADNASIPLGCRLSQLLGLSPDRQKTAQLPSLRLMTASEGLILTWP